LSFLLNGYANTLSPDAMVILHKPVPGLTELSLDRFVLRARRITGLRGRVTVLVTSSREMRRLNQRFRGKDKPTDVLSFPPAPLVAKGFAGDLAISAEIAAQNARRLGHSPAEEIKILSLHGVLHLRGYDHENDKGQMARREQQLRKQLGVPLALIERSETASVKPPSTRARATAPTARKKNSVSSTCTPSRSAR
jgi:probable rRNA maturation factor